MTANISAARPKPTPQAAYPEIRRDPRDGHRAQTRLNTGPPGFSLRPGPASAPLQGQVRGTGGAKARPGGGGIPRGLLAGWHVPVSAKGPQLAGKLHLRPRAPRPFHALNFIATALAPPWRSPSSRRETRKGKPLERPPACPRHPSSSPGPGLVSAALSPSPEPADSPPPYSPPLRTKKAAGNPGLAGVQVTSCFLMGSNSD